MKVYRMIITVVLAALLVGIFVAPAFAAPKESTSIEGKITTSTGQPILAGTVGVIAYTIEPLINDGSEVRQSVRQATTIVQAKGKYSFTGLAPGTYRIKAFPADPELAYGFYGITKTEPSVWLASDVVFTGKALKNINIQLDVAAHITGRVVDEYGNPVYYVGVSATVQPGWFLDAASEFVRTKADGTFDIPRLPAISSSVTVPGYGNVWDEWYCPPDPSTPHGYFVFVGAYNGVMNPDWQPHVLGQAIWPEAGETINAGDLVIYPMPQP